MAGNYGKHVNRNTGGNTARVSTIPKLEQQAVIQQYENTQPRYNRIASPIQNLVNYAEDMKTRQALANDYNAIKNAQTQQTLERLGQTDIARGSNSFAVEQAKRGNLMSGLINSLADNEKFGNLTTFLAGSSPSYDIFRNQQNEAMKGTLTNEMQRAGLTQEDIDRWNRQQNNAERQEVLSNYAKTHPVLATLNAFPENIAGSAEGVLDKLTSYVTGNPLEAKPTNAELYRSAVSSGIDSKVGNFAYNVGNSIGDMLLAQLVTGGLGKGKVGAALMGLEKADPVMNSAIERGLTPTQILAEGIGSGITTGITEAIPFGRFAEGGHILGSMAAEGLQEGAEDIADTLLDRIVTSVGGNSDRSEWNQNIQAYLDAGYTEEEAKQAVESDYLKQLGLDIAAGAVSGGVMQGGTNVLNQRNFVTGQERIPQLTNEQLNAIPEVDENGNLVKLEEEIKAEEQAQPVDLNEVKAEAEQAEAQQTIPQVEQPAVQSTDNRTLKSIKDIANAFLAKVMNTKGQTDERWNQKRLGIVPADVANMVSRASGGSLNIANKYFAIEGGKLWHEINEHSDVNIEKSRGQIPLNSSDISEIVETMYRPDIVENISNNLETEQRGTFALIRKAKGYVVLVEAVGGKRNPNIVPEQILHLGDAKMQRFLNGDISIGDILYENSSRKGDIEGNTRDIKNRVTAAQLVSDNETPVHTSETYRRSPLFDPNVTQTEENVNSSRIDEDVENIQTLEEAATVLDGEISALNNEVGNHPMNIEYFGRNESGEVESEDSDRVQTGRYKTSKAYTNTAERSGNLTDEQRSAVEADGRMQYQENSEKESVAEAEKRIIEGGWKGEFDKLTQKDAKDFNNVDVDELFILWRHYKEEAMALDAKGLDSTSAWEKTVDCLTQVKAVGSSAGSELQAFAKWSRNNTPEGLLSQAETIIEEVTRGAKKNPWFAQIAKETKGKTRQMDVAFIKEFLTEAEKLDGLDIDSREAKHIMANLGKMVNSRIPVTLREKIVTILMDNMLGNFRTLIARNAGGNVGFNLIEQKVTKNLAAKIDKALSTKRGTTRTISENTSEGRSAYREGFKEAVKQEIYDFQNNIQSARSGENTLRTAVANNRQIFSQKSVFGKIGNLYNKLVKTGLSSGDRPFYEGVYNQYMTEFKKMRDDGLLMEMSDADFEKLAKANAQIKALEAVYQDDSSMAQAFMGMKNAVNELSKGIVGADVLSQFTMPFVKTPANIIQRAIEYSPIGIVKNAIQTVREVRHAMTENEIMDFDQQRFATETARNIIGSVMFMLAIMAAKSGALTGGYSEDKDMAQAQREAGMQEYALHNPLGFNGDVDVSWLPVVGNNLVAAAAAYDAASKPELTTAQRIGQGLTAGLRTQFESSALQGLQRLVGGSNYSSSNGGDLLTNAVDTLKSGATQFIPSLARQAASTADPYRRQLTGANPDDYYINSVLNSIPGLRQNLQPRIARTGEYMEQNTGRSGLWKAFDNFINPATITRGTEDAVRDEAMRLFEATGNNIAFQPGVSINELKTEDHVPTAEEFTQYQQTAYGNMNQIATQVINSSYYQNLTDGEKETLLDSIYKAVKSVEKANILGTDKSNLSGAAKAYNEGGAEGLIDYATAKSVLAEMGMDNTVKNREYILETLNEGGTEAVNQILELSDELVQAGLTGSLTEQYAYNHAAQYIPSLTPTQFATEYTNLNYDGQSGITQKDILAYVNQNPTAYTEEDMYRLWNAYGQSSWSKQPYWNGEKWTSK